LLSWGRKRINYKTNKYINVKLRSRNGTTKSEKKTAKGKKKGTKSQMSDIMRKIVSSESFTNLLVAYKVERNGKFDVKTSLNKTEETQKEVNGKKCRM
jgi:hypothetical protein